MGQDFLDISTLRTTKISELKKKLNDLHTQIIHRTISYSVKKHYKLINYNIILLYFGCTFIYQNGLGKPQKNGHFYWPCH